jgi:hypothetical protein
MPVNDALIRRADSAAFDSTGRATRWPGYYPTQDDTKSFDAAARAGEASLAAGEARNAQ